MIAVDTSALVAIIANEPERVRFLTIMDSGEPCYISAVTLYEAQIVVLARFGDAGLTAMAKLIDEFGLRVLAFDQSQVDLATQAYRRFGKGIGSPGALNLCDCAAYALAKSLDAPLLYKGKDFAATDIIAAIS